MLSTSFNIFLALVRDLWWIISQWQKLRGQSWVLYTQEGFRANARVAYNNILAGILHFGRTQVTCMRQHCCYSFRRCGSHVPSPRHQTPPLNSLLPQQPLWSLAPSIQICRGVRVKPYLSHSIWVYVFIHLFLLSGKYLLNLWTSILLSIPM